MTQGFNNDIKLLTYDPLRKIVDPSLGKGIDVNKWAGGGYSSGGNPVVMNKPLFSTTGIKGFGGPIGAGVILSQAARDAANWAWLQNNLNTMAPSKRNAILKAAGKENEISKYSKQKDTLDDYLMPPLAKAVAKLIQGGVNYTRDMSDGSNANTSTTSSTGVPGQPDFDIIDDNQLTNGVSINPGTTRQTTGKLQTKTGIPSGGQPTSQPQAQEQQLANLKAINDYIEQLKEINRPYVDALQSYLDNYNNMLRERQRASRYWQGAAALTGDQNWARLGEQYNPLTNEVNRLSAIKQLQDAKAGDINAINEVMGNMALAKEMDLPYETAFANKNLLTALTANRRMLTDWEKAQLAAELKRYGIDVGYNRALDVQNLRNLGSKDVALINAMAYGNPMLYGNQIGGLPAPGLTPQGTAQLPTAMNNVQPQGGMAGDFQRYSGR